MTPLERIDQYLGQQLSADEVADLERDLREDPALQQLLDSVDMTRRVVRTQAIKAQVRQVHSKFIADYRQQNGSGREPDEQDEQDAPVIPLNGRSANAGRPFGWVVRIAATVLLAVVGYGGYQYAAVDRQAIYDDTFVAYQLPTTRAAGVPQPVIDSLYRAGSYAAVIRRLATIPPRQQQSQQRFLAGVSHLQLGQFAAAVNQFQALQQANRRSTTPYFEQETDYYQALAYLGAGSYELAYANFERIHDNPRHLFRGNVSRMDLWKIKLLTYK